MSPERLDLPDWARNDREADMAWIRENLEAFWPLARDEYLASGRGTFVVDVTRQLEPDSGHPFGYFPQDKLEKEGEEPNEDLMRMVRDYKPAKEFVILLLKQEERESCYRVEIQRKGTNGKSH